MKKYNLHRALLSSPLSLVLIAACAVSACDSNKTTEEVMTTDGATPDGATNDTSKAISEANWTENVTISIDQQQKNFRYQSDGIPATGLADAYLVPDDPSTMPFADDPPESFWTLSAGEIQETPIDVTITTSPVFSESTTETSLGQIGVAINGARIFNDYEDRERQVVALNDNVIHDHAAFVDECNGHPLGDGTTYHYHGIPLCISDSLDVDSQHSFMIGVLQDGFPAYADNGAGGVTMTSSDLDECGGHVEATPEFPDGIYHYHLTADEAPYSIDCYHGEVTQAVRRGRPDFGAAAEQLGISEEALLEALGDGPPDFDSASEILGISAEALQSALPPPQ